MTICLNRNVQLENLANVYDGCMATGTISTDEGQPEHCMPAKAFIYIPHVNANHFCLF